MANCLFYCSKLLLLKYFYAAKLQPAANAHTQVTSLGEEYVRILSPTSLSNTSVQTFSVKSVLPLTAKDPEIKYITFYCHVVKIASTFAYMEDKEKKNEDGKTMCTHMEQVV